MYGLYITEVVHLWSVFDDSRPEHCETVYVPGFSLMLVCLDREILYMSLRDDIEAAKRRNGDLHTHGSGLCSLLDMICVCISRVL